jgi:hypothetical protein
VVDVGLTRTFNGGDARINGDVAKRFRWPHLSRRARWTVAIFAGVLALGVALSYLVDEPLRRHVEGQMNARLTGYTVSIGALSFHPIGLSLTLDDLVFVQEANPDPPIGHIARLEASVQWWALLSGRLVANFALERPRLYVNLQHLEREAGDSEPLTRKGWQEAFEAIYPLKINEFTVVDGVLTYVADRRFAPLHASHLNFTAHNIRNIRSPEDPYPSPTHLDAVIFGTGKVVLDGHANFLTTPHPGMKGAVSLEGIDLDYFKALTNRYNVSVRRGRLRANGTVEYAPTVKAVDLEQATIRDVHVEYVHTPAKEGVVQEAAAATVRTAQAVSNEPGVYLRAREVRVIHSTVGFVNRAVNPAYRAFVSDLNLRISNFSTHAADGASVAQLTGKFMGSGDADARATFRPDKQGPDFDLKVSLENTDLRTMNDMLRAYGKFDVAAGTFSLFSEIRVKNRYIEGYVKPLFGGLDVYDPAQDRDKSLVRKLYEKAVEGVSKVLKNAPREEVATVATISGPIDTAQANTLEVIVKIIQNAFFKAILPGFDRHAARRGPRQP